MGLKCIVVLRALGINRLLDGTVPLYECYYWTQTLRTDMQVTLLPAMCLFEVLKAIFVTGGCQQAAHTEDTAGRQPSIHIAFSIASLMCIGCEVKSQGVMFFLMFHHNTLGDPGAITVSFPVSGF
jgi:hypothetical protein